MSNIPSSAMPHAYAHDDDESSRNKGQDGEASGPSTGMLIGGAVAAYVLYRILR